MTQLQFKTRLFTAIVVLTNVLGNAFMKYGMGKVGDPGVSPLLYIKAIFNPAVSAGVLLLILWMLSRMTLLSWADLSYALPLTSAGYILQAFVGRFWFDERISMSRWAGTLLIVGGIALVNVTKPRTT